MPRRGDGRRRAEDGRRRTEDGGPSKLYRSSLEFATAFVEPWLDRPLKRQRRAIAVPYRAAANDTQTISLSLRA